MALPRRCQQCKCYVAPHLLKCPRCGRAAPIAIPTALRVKDERAERNAREEAKLPKIMHVKWKPSEFAVRQYQLLEKEILRRLDKADTARARNAIRSELRLTRKVIADGKKKGTYWRSEIAYELSGAVFIFISPKGRRYVRAEKDETASLLMRMRERGLPKYVRLVRFETSNVFGRIQLEKKIAKQAMQKAVSKAKESEKKQKRIAGESVDTLL